MLREEAQALEDAGKSSDMAFIASHHAHFIEDLKEVGRLLEPLSRADEHRAQKMADAAFIQGLYDGLMTAAQDMDCDAIEDLFASAQDYAFPPGDEELITELKAHADRFDYDAVVEALQAHATMAQ